MLAVRKMRKGAGNVELQEVDIPVPGDDDVLMKVWAAGICGSDLNVEDDTHFYTPPVTLGHEYSGVAEAVGKNVTKVKVGDKIVADIETAEGWLGSGVDGAFAPYMRVPEDVVHVCPADMSLDAAALVEPVVATLHCLQERSNINAGDFVVVVGPGPMGILAIQFAKMRGARAVAIVGLAKDVERLRVARDVGADHVLIYEEDAAAKIMALTEGEGADFVADCAGTESGTQLAIDIAKSAHEGPGGRGQIALVSMWGNPISLRFDKVSMKQLSLSGGWSWNGPQTWKRAIQLLYSGGFNYQAMITNRYRIEQWQEAFQNLRDKKDVKAFIHPNGTGWLEEGQS